MEYVEETLSKPSVLHKQVFILGDFNINLLKYDSHSPTSDFIRGNWKMQVTRSCKMQVMP